MKKILRSFSKEVFKDKGYIIGMSMLSIVVLINMYYYFKDTSYFDRDYNPYVFWSYVRLSSIPASIMINLVPIIVLISSITSFAREIYTGYYKNYLSRIEYKKYFINKIKWCYIRSIFTLPVMSFIVLGIGCLLYPQNITQNFDNAGIGFLNDKFQIAGEAFSAVMYLMIPLILYGMIITTLGLIAIRFTNRIYVTYTVGYIGYLLMNSFFTTEITLKLYDLLNKPSDFTNISLQNLYYAVETSGQKYVIAYNLVVFVILNIIVFNIYKNREYLVLGLRKKEIK